MTDTATHAPVGSLAGAGSHDRALKDWLAAFQQALAAADGASLAELFATDAAVRELLAMSWDFRNAVGREEIVDLLTGPETAPPVSIAVSPDREPIVDHENNGETVASFLVFETDLGTGKGYVKLVEGENGSWQASALVLALQNLDSHPERLEDNRPLGRLHGPVHDRVGWSESLDHEFAEQDPTVLILGAGHNGLMLAARLRALGISALIVEPNERVGDNWRKRYKSLALHTPLASDHLPYIPFPPTWTRFTPKDKLGDFLESYATLLDLAVWTGSHAENVAYDETTGRWKADIVRPDGTRRSMTPEHLVLATGLNAEPLLPQLPGQDRFAGRTIHAVQYRGYEEWVGKSAVVVGSGVSGHDLAQDLAEHGVDVTMIQRSGTVVMNTSTFHTVMHANHISSRYSTDEADLVNAATPFGELPKYGGQQLIAANAMDRELLDGLENAGFELSSGPDGQGVLGLIFGQNATGYYYNAGASELIVDGTIKLRKGSVTGFTESGIVLDDGSTVDADLVVFATGYRGATSVVQKVLGDDIAARLGNFTDIGADREFGRLWRDSGMDRLWYMISLDIGNGRFYSKLLALQIAAIEAGSHPKS